MKKKSIGTVGTAVDFGICQYCGRPGSDGFNGPAEKLQPSHFDCLQKANPELFRTREEIEIYERAQVVGAGI